MVVVHVPTSQSVNSLASVAGYLVDGLDAIITGHAPSAEYGDGYTAFTIQGNPRDTQVAAERAAAIGGVGE